MNDNDMVEVMTPEEHEGEWGYWVNRDLAHECPNCVIEYTVEDFEENEDGVCVIEHYEYKITLCEAHRFIDKNDGSLVEVVEQGEQIPQEDDDILVNTIEKYQTELFMLRVGHDQYLQKGDKETAEKFLIGAGTCTFRLMDLYHELEAE